MHYNMSCVRVLDGQRLHHATCSADGRHSWRSFQPWHCLMDSNARGWFGGARTGRISSTCPDLKSAAVCPSAEACYVRGFLPALAPSIELVNHVVVLAGQKSQLEDYLESDVEAPQCLEHLSSTEDLSHSLVVLFSNDLRCWWVTLIPSRY